MRIITAALLLGLLLWLPTPGFCGGIRMTDPEMEATGVRPEEAGRTTAEEAAELFVERLPPETIITSIPDFAQFGGGQSALPLPSAIYPLFSIGGVPTRGIPIPVQLR